MIALPKAGRTSRNSKGVLPQRAIADAKAVLSASEIGEDPKRYSAFSISPLCVAKVSPKLSRLETKSP